MKRGLFTAYIIMLVGIVPSCKDFLETRSASTMDGDYVVSSEANIRMALNGLYETWRDYAQNRLFGDGLWYAADVPGSDITRHPEAFANQPGRHWPECLYQNGSYTGQYGLLSYLKENDVYAGLYKLIAVSNAVTESVEAREDYESVISGEPSEMGQLYGEAVAMRATAYRELIKNFGDVPYTTHIGDVAQGLTGRDWIYEKCLQELQRVEPIMQPVRVKSRFSQTYVDGLIGRMALEAGGYQTRRNDMERVDLSGNPISYEQLGTENNDAVYARRIDWQRFYALARTYFHKAFDEHSGSAVFHDTDPRTSEANGRCYNNPYQYFFQQMMDGDGAYADESIYEYPMQQGIVHDARPYSFGRPSNGGSKNAFPCKAYGQGRINPAFYYGVFDPQDKRRDVAVSVTGSDGAGCEVLIPFVPNSKAIGGGLSLNKWDENRQSSPWVMAQRVSGINGPYMRLSEMYLGYAEACAALGDNAEARTYLDKIRNRAFGSAAKAKTDAFIAQEGSLLNAIIQERGFEFAGEGDRRFTLIRTGLLPVKVKYIKQLTRAMIDGLKAEGVYTFANGNTISNFIYTKPVDARLTKGYRLTTQCPDGQEDDPVLYPGWRGQNDNWEKYGCKYADGTETNLAIRGLFSPLDAQQISDLLADGYVAQAWGADIVAYEEEYYTYLFYDYDYTRAPIYLWPFTPQILSAGGFTNGYGFRNE